MNLFDKPSQLVMYVMNAIKRAGNNLLALRETQFNKSDYNLGLLTKSLKDAEQATACRIHLVFQKAASGYFFVSAVFAAFVAFFVGLLMNSVLSSSLFLLVLQILVFSMAFSVCNLTDLKYNLTPDFLKQKFAQMSLGQVLKQMNRTSTDANVLVMVSQQEVFAKVIPSASVANQVPPTVWQAIHNSLMIDVGHGEGAKGLKNSTSAITKLLKVYFPAIQGGESQGVNNRLEIRA